MAEEKKPGRGLMRMAIGAATYGVRRPYRDLVSSGKSIKTEWGRFQAARAQREAMARQQRKDFEARMHGLTPSEKFAAEVNRGGWTSANLREQERAARIARRASLVMSAVGFVGFLVFMYFATVIMGLVFGLLAMALLACCIAQAVRNAWWEFQLQGKVLVPLRDFLARPDLFRRLFS